MAQKHLFIIDPLESLNMSLDSSMRMARALAARNHRVFLATIQDISWHSGKPSAWVRQVEAIFPTDGGDGSWAPELGEKSTRSLVDFDAIHMRKDPPFDLTYIEATWLLDSVRHKVRIYNDPSALRTYNEKMAILQFPDDIRPALISSEPNEIMEFIEKECAGDAVLKPLGLFGGQGVERLRLGAGGLSSGKASRSIATMTRGGAEKRIIQPFDPAIFDGEVRAFCIGGEPVAWCLKKPATGEFLANTRAGATLHSYQPSLDDLARVKNVGAKLALAGVHIVGFDLIGGFVSEINVTSPRLLSPESDSPEALTAYDSFARWIERDVGTAQRQI